MHRPVKISLTSILFLIASAALGTSAPEMQVPREVLAVFTENCARCHGDRVSYKGINLGSPKAILATAISRPSTEKPQFFRIQPGSPDSSYLMMKIIGTPGIEESRMPFGSDPLSRGKIQAIASWIKSLSPGLQSNSAIRNPVHEFPGWTIGNLASAETLERGQMLFLFDQRYVPKTEEGYDEFYGLNGPTVSMFSLGYAVSDNLLVAFGRTNARDVVELYARYRLFQQIRDEFPVSLAIQGTIDWESVPPADMDRFRNAAFSYTIQAIGSRQFFDRLSLAVVPGVTFYPNSVVDGEDPLFTVGIGGRVYIGMGLSFITEFIPIISENPDAPVASTRYRDTNRFNTFSVGLEEVFGGHVFQLIATNTQGIATSQYLSGGDLDFGSGDMRFGVAVYRILGY